MQSGLGSTEQRAVPSSSVRGQDEEFQASDTGFAAVPDTSSSHQPALDVYSTTTTGPELTGRRVTMSIPSADGSTTVEGSRVIERSTTPGQTDASSQGKNDASSQGQNDASRQGRP